MERLRLMFRHGPIVGIALVIVAGVLVVALDGRGWLWALVPLGIPAQMLNEYNLHRFIFHLPPPRSHGSSTCSTAPITGITISQPTPISSSCRALSCCPFCS